MIELLNSDSFDERLVISLINRLKKHAFQEEDGKNR
jgi:hypothetical protein